MSNSIEQLHSNDAFRERAKPFRVATSGEPVASLEALFDQMRRFAGVRRREVRIAQLEQADRSGAADAKPSPELVQEAAAAFSSGKKILHDHVTALRPLFRRDLDEVLALMEDDGHPLRQYIREAAITMGFAGEEAEWMLGELKNAEYRPMRALGNDAVEDLSTLLESLSDGEGNLLHAGFPRFTGNPDTDARIEKVVIALREKGVTVSIFLVVVLVLTAHAAATLK